MFGFNRSIQIFTVTYDCSMCSPISIYMINRQKLSDSFTTRWTGAFASIRSKDFLFQFFIVPFPIYFSRFIAFLTQCIINLRWSRTTFRAQSPSNSTSIAFFVIRPYSFNPFNVILSPSKIFAFFATRFRAKSCCQSTMIPDCKFLLTLLTAFFNLLSTTSVIIHLFTFLLNRRACPFGQMQWIWSDFKVTPPADFFSASLMKPELAHRIQMWPQPSWGST